MEVKTVGKYVGVLVFVALVLLSVGYNGLVIFNGYKASLIQEGSNIAVIQIGSIIQAKGEIELPAYEQDKNDKSKVNQVGTVTLIQKPNDTKK